jgi:hypothetical protein
MKYTAMLHMEIIAAYSGKPYEAHSKNIKLLIIKGGTNSYHWDLRS